jgi:hypothetical protein
MIRITITPAAFAAIAATLALGTVAVEPERDEDGSVHIWLDPGILARLQRRHHPRCEGGVAYSFQTMSQPGRADPQTTTGFLEPPPTGGRLRTGDAASVMQSRSPGIPSAGKVATVLWPIVAARQAVMKAARSIDRLYPL